MSALMHDQSRHVGVKHFCERCLYGFSRADLPEKHKPECKGQLKRHIVCSVAGLDEINQVSFDRFPALVTGFVISWIFKFSFRGAVRINVNASKTAVCPSREAKITRWVNPELVADSFVRSHVIMVIERIECRIFGQSAHALNTSEHSYAPS